MKKLALSLLAAAFTLGAQTPPDLKTLSGGTMALYQQTRRALIGAAEKMPAEHYGYAPTDGIRNFGQLVGHVADAQYLFCSPVAGTPNPAPGVEKSKHSKDELVAALKDAFAYCDKAYASLTDANAAELVKFFGGERTKLNVLSFSFMHNYEHYGNMVTYMRMKNIVPPTSEPRTPPAAKK